MPARLRSDPAPRTGRGAAVMAHIRARIAGGGLGAGARLPSVRRCAATLGVSPSTVVDAYDRLVGEGEIAARRGAGFFVAGRPPVARAVAAGPAREREVDPRWVMRHALEAPPGAAVPGCGWLPDDWMPLAAVRRAGRAVLAGAAGPLVGYGAPLGWEPLRALVGRRLNERDIAATPGHLMLADSASHALDLVCRLFVRPGDAVLVDDPCYFNHINILRAHGARLIGIPYGPAGPDLAAFAQAAARHAPRLYLTTAALHNPTGATLAPGVQHRLLTLAEAHDLVIVEDDVFAAFEPEPTPRLAAFDGLDRVVLIGSWSKTLSASIRCGIVAARPDWIEALTDLKLAASFGTSDLPARIVHRLLVDGGYRRHVEATRTRLARSRDLVRGRLRGLGLEILVEPRGGMFLWTRLPGGLDAAVVSRHAQADGVVLAPGDAFSVDGRSGDCLRFNVAQCVGPRVFEVLAAAMAAAGKGRAA